MEAAHFLLSTYLLCPSYTFLIVFSKRSVFIVTVSSKGPEEFGSESHACERQELNLDGSGQVNSLHLTEHLRQKPDGTV